MKLHLVILPSFQIAAALSEGDDLDHGIWTSDESKDLSNPLHLAQLAHELNEMLKIEGLQIFNTKFLIMAFVMLNLSPCEKISFVLS